MPLNIKKSLENHLKSYAALKAIHKGQVCFGRAPSTWTAPYQNITKISDPAENRRLGVPCPRFQVDNFAPTQAQADLMAELTIQSLDGFSGVMGGTGGKKIVTGKYMDSTDLYEPDTGLYNCPVDVKIQYRN
jgi:hypothetical protein